MSITSLTTLKTYIAALLPDASRTKIAKLREANEIMMDYMYIPFGVPFPYLGHTIPSNCHLCNGYLLKVSDYPLLYAEIGDTYTNLGHGALGGFTNGTIGVTFNLPFIPKGGSIIQAGTNSVSGTTFTVGQTGGEVNHLLTLSEMSAHSHYLFSEGDQRTAGDIRNDNNKNKTITREATGTSDGNNDYLMYCNDDAVTRGKSSITGGLNNITQAHNNMQPFIVGNWIMRLK